MNSIFPPNAPTISIHESNNSDSDNLLPPTSCRQPGRLNKRRIYESLEGGTVGQNVHFIVVVVALQVIPGKPVLGVAI